MPEPVRYYARRGRLLVFAAGSLLFVAAGAWLVTSFGTLGFVIGLVALVFFGLAALFFLRELLWRRPTLRIDRDGLVDRSTALPAGRIAWRDIATVRVFASGRQRMLGITLRDPETFAASASRLSRLLIRANTRQGQPEVAVPRSALPVPFETVIAQMREHHPKLVVRDP